MADLKDTIITGDLAVSGSSNIGGATQVSGDLTLYTSGTGDSPGLIFQRGTLTDNYNDWRIYDTGGQLKFQQRGLSSASWTNEVSMSSAGDITATTFTGSGANLTNLNYNNISNPPTIPTVDYPVTDIKVDNASVVSGKVAGLVSSSSHPYNGSSNPLATIADIGAAGGGTVTSVGLSNASNGGLSISGSPITSSGSITVGHSNVLANAQTTQGIYPIKIDKNGHISEYGSAVTIPAAANNGNLKLQKNTGTASSIFTADQSGDSTLKFTTTSVGSASGWNAGTMASIDTSKFNGGSFTQGTDSFTANTPTAIDTSKFNGGSFTRGSFSGGSFTQGSDSFTAATLSVSGGGNTASAASTLTLTFGGGSFTQGSDSFTAATHAADSFTAASLSSGFYSAGTAASFTQGTDQHTAASLGTGFYSAGTAPSLTVSSTTVVNDITNN